MAKAELDILLDKLSGRLTGNSVFYVTHRHGRTIISNYPKTRDLKKISAKQRENSASFGELSKQCKAEMQDSERRAYWEEHYAEYTQLANKSLARANARFFNIDPNTTPPAKQKFYSTLRGFVIRQLRKQKI